MHRHNSALVTDRRQDDIGKQGPRRNPLRRSLNIPSLTLEVGKAARVCILGTLLQACGPRPVDRAGLGLMFGAGRQQPKSRQQSPGVSSKERHGRKNLLGSRREATSYLSIMVLSAILSLFGEPRFGSLTLQSRECLANGLFATQRMGWHGVPAVKAPERHRAKVLDEGLVHSARLSPLHCGQVQAKVPSQKRIYRLAFGRAVIMTLGWKMSILDLGCRFVERIHRANVRELDGRIVLGPVFTIRDQQLRTWRGERGNFCVVGLVFIAIK